MSNMSKRKLLREISKINFKCFCNVCHHKTLDLKIIENLKIELKPQQILCLKFKKGKDQFDFCSFGEER